MDIDKLIYFYFQPSHVTVFYINSFYFMFFHKFECWSQWPVGSVLKHLVAVVSFKYALTPYATSVLNMCYSTDSDRTLVLSIISP